MSSSNKDSVNCIWNLFNIFRSEKDMVLIVTFSLSTDIVLWVREKEVDGFRGVLPRDFPVNFQNHIRSTTE